jgi:DNA-directed RNA polymerase subunit RPC12/RpoP
MDAVDGNAIGGLLIDVFGAEMTAASSTCATCGATRPVAELVVYRWAPGTVVRCRTCGSVLMVLVRRADVTSVDLSGLASLSQPGSALSRGRDERQACMPNEHADNELGRDQNVTRTVHVNVGRASGSVHVHGPAARRLRVMAGRPRIHR